MTQNFDIRPVDLNYSRSVEMLTEMLGRNALRLDPVDIYLGIYDYDDHLLGGGGLCGNVIKCVAIDSSLRGESITNTLITNLRNIARYNGHSNIFIYTKPENEQLFRSMAFHTVAKASEAIMLESAPRGISAYCDYLKSLRKDGRNAAIVMNCNPMTKGHLSLIRKAASEVDNLYIIPVKEDKSVFPYSMRREMMVAGCSDIENVVVCEGSDYAVSAATFPSYFLKNIDHATDTSIMLDLDIFARHIAPALGVSVRFAGSEPIDALTRRYNELMSRALPESGIDFVEVNRFREDGVPVSATSVRKAIDGGDGDTALRLAAPGGRHILMAHFAANALRRELELTPKPGLIDHSDNGSHSDMDFELMQRSIESLERGLIEILAASNDTNQPLPDMEVALQAEKDMFEATGGINTHKGALFATSLVLLSAQWLLNQGETITAERLSSMISRYAAAVPGAENTHGSQARIKYGVAGALENARNGYQELFNQWLPYYRSLPSDPKRDHKMLLKIMSTLDDTNVLHRAGAEGAKFVKETSARLLEDFSLDGLKELNREYTERNISPGGAADMLGLIFLIDFLTK